MNIKQIIAEEVAGVLGEQGVPVDDILQQLETLAPNQLGAAAEKLLPSVEKGLQTFFAQGAEEVTLNEGDGFLGPGLAKFLKAIPGGLDIGAMYLSTIDEKTPPAIRVAFLVALANLVSPVDAGTLLGLDFLGPLAALDDYVIIRSVLKKYKKEGLPAPEHYARLEQLATGAEPEPEIIDVTPLESPSGEEEDQITTAPFPAVEADPLELTPQMKRRPRPGPKELKESGKMKLTKLNLYNIIKEEVKAVLINKRTERFFNLDVSQLLDEMMNEENKPLQKLAKGVEERGTEGTFKKYCGGEVTQACIDRAAKAGGHRAKQASLAVTFSKAKGGGPSLTYPKKED